MSTELQVLQEQLAEAKESLSECEVFAQSHCMTPGQFMAEAAMARCQRRVRDLEAEIANKGAA